MQEQNDHLDFSEVCDEEDQQIQAALQASLLELQNTTHQPAVHFRGEVQPQSVAAEGNLEEVEELNRAIQLSLEDAPSAHKFPTEPNNSAAFRRASSKSFWEFQDFAENVGEKDFTELLLGSDANRKLPDDKFIIPFQIFDGTAVSVAETLSSPPIVNIHSTTDATNNAVQQSSALNVTPSTNVTTLSVDDQPLDCNQISPSSSSSADNVAGLCDHPISAPKDTHSSGAGRGWSDNVAMLPIEFDDLNKILQTIFGRELASHENDIIRWFNQGLLFSKTVNWGLLQSHGGPCGVLASIQSWLICVLFFYNERVRNAIRSHGNLPVKVDDVPMLEFCSEDIRSALIEAFCFIIYQCTPTSRYIIASLEGPNSQIFDQAARSGSIASAVTGYWTELDNIRSVFNFYYSNPALLRAQTSVISLVASVVATRGVDKIKRDMDDESQALVGVFGHCTQELVNLLLTGRAISNVFDGDRTLGSDGATSCISFGGIMKRPAIGFLTEFEGLRYMEVGLFLKHPHFPIWVIGCSDHYTTLFSADFRVARLSGQELAEKEACELYGRYDTNGDHVVFSHFLEPILEECGMREYYDEAFKAIDFGCGVILQRDFVEWFILKKMSMGLMGSDPPRRMTIYFYNGQLPLPTLRRYLVEISDISAEYAQSITTEISRLLSTRWPNCIVSELPLWDSR